MNFVRHVIAMAVAGETVNQAPLYAASRWGASSAAAQITRAAVAPLNTSDDVLADFDSAAREFYSAASQLSVVGRLERLRRVPLATRVITGSGSEAHWVGERNAKPLAAMVFSADTLEPLKIVALTVQSQDLLRRSDNAAEALIRADLLRSVVERLDASLLDPNNAGVAGVSPAAITNGIVPRISTGEIQLDLGDLVAEFSGSLESACFVAHPSLFAKLAGPIYPSIGLRDGELLNAPALVSRAVPTDALILLDPTGIAYGEGRSVVRTSSEADIEMSSTPTTSTTTRVSLWQTNAVGILAEQEKNWAVARAGAVSMLTGVLSGSV